MSLTILHKGLDTLEISYAGNVRDEIADKLDLLKEAAQLNDEEQPLEVIPYEFMVQPRAFGRWRWMISNPELQIVLNRTDSPNRVSAQVRFLAFGLMNSGAKMLLDCTEIVMGQLGMFKEVNVARADVCVNCQGWTPTLAQVARGLVTHAKFRPIYPSIDDAQTFQIGKRDQVVRIYNKTKQIAPDKRDLYRLYWGAAEGFNRDAEVWRVECRLRRKVLAELGMHTARQVIANQASILDYCMREYAQLRIPTEDATKTRWPEDPVWTELRTAQVFGVPLSRSVKPSTAMSLDAVVGRLLGILTTSAAYFEEDEIEPTMIRLAYALEARVKQDNIDFGALVEKARRRIMSGE